MHTYLHNFQSINNILSINTFYILTNYVKSFVLAVSQTSSELQMFTKKDTNYVLIFCSLHKIYLSIIIKFINNFLNQKFYLLSVNFYGYRKLKEYHLYLHQNYEKIWFVPCNYLQLKYILFEYIYFWNNKIYFFKIWKKLFRI